MPVLVSESSHERYVINPNNAPSIQDTMMVNHQSVFILYPSEEKALYGVKKLGIMEEDLGPNCSHVLIHECAGGNTH